MTMSETRVVFDRLETALNQHDRQAISACYGDDVALVAPEGAFKGRDEATAYLVSFLDAFPDLHIDNLSKTTSGDVAIDEWIFTGTNTGPLALPDGTNVPATGRRVNVRGCDVAVVTGGAITSHRVYYDLLDLMTQLGLAAS